MIPFNKPYLIGNETKLIEEAVSKGKISGNGYFTKLCQSFFDDKFNSLIALSEITLMSLINCVVLISGFL